MEMQLWKFWIKLKIFSVLKSIFHTAVLTFHLTKAISTLIFFSVSHFVLISVNNVMLFLRAMLQHVTALRHVSKRTKNVTFEPCNNSRGFLRKIMFLRILTTEQNIAIFGPCKRFFWTFYLKKNHVS